MSDPVGNLRVVVHHPIKPYAVAETLDFWFGHKFSVERHRLLNFMELIDVCRSGLVGYYLVLKCG